jgi:uncharacterized protein
MQNKNLILKKYNKLKKNLLLKKRVLIAYSGGVDSTLLLHTSLSVLTTKNVLAVIAQSETYPQREINFALEIVKKWHVNYKLIETCELEDKKFKKNPENRCYYCKMELFSTLKKLAKKEKINYVCDGANYSDNFDFRPGSYAAKEIGVSSPLKELRITKDEIYFLSKKFNLPTKDKPSFACLSSRIPYYEEITKDKLKKINKAEEILLNYGFKVVRARYHYPILRIEVSEKEINKFLKNNKRGKIVKELKQLGFLYITLDLEGYKSGSMNRVLERKSSDIENYRKG